MRNKVERQMEDFRYNVWALRTNKGWTQERLAEEAHLSHVTICRLETGSRIYGQMQTCLAVANALDADLNEMFNTMIPVKDPVRPYVKNWRTRK